MTYYRLYYHCSEALKLVIYSFTQVLAFPRDLIRVSTSHRPLARSRTLDILEADFHAVTERRLGIIVLIPDGA